MTQVSFPETTTTLSAAIAQIIAQQAQKILVCSQKTSAGTAVSGALQTNIQTDANGLAGKTSMGAAVVRAVRDVNTDTRVDAIFLADNGAAFSAGAANFTGSTATESGELTIVLGSKRHNAIKIAITDGDSATVIGDALDAAVAAATATNRPPPVTTANTLGNVAVMAENAGTEGDSIPIEVIGSVAGVTVAITAMTGGAVDPVTTSIFDAIGDERYQTILWSWSSNLNDLIAFVDGRLNVTDDVLDGLGYVAAADTLVNHTSALTPLRSLINYTNVKKESAATFESNDRSELPWVLSAYAGALTALKLTVGAAIADLNSGESGLDSIGGPALASRPFANTPVAQLIPSDVGRGWTRLEIEQLNDLGGSVIGNNRAGNQVILGQQLTTRITDPAGSPDNTFKFVNFYKTGSLIREIYDSTLRATYAQSRLTDGDIVPGRPMVNENTFQAKLTEIYSVLSDADFVATRAGQQALNFFKASIVTSLNLSEGTITWSVKTPINVQVRKINGDIQITFDIVESSGTTQVGG